MEGENFIKQFLKATRFGVLESNLNLELLGKLNDITAGQYSGMIADATKIEKELQEFAEAYGQLDSVFDEIGNLTIVIDDLEKTVEFLEEATNRIETKLKHAN